MVAKELEVVNSILHFGLPKIQFCSWKLVSIPLGKAWVTALCHEQTVLSQTKADSLHFMHACETRGCETTQH